MHRNCKPNATVRATPLRARRQVLWGKPVAVPRVGNARLEVVALNVVVTGSTKGIGLALASEFASKGDSVCICSRDGTKVDQVVRQLSERFPEATVCGVPCDVTSVDDVAALARRAKDSLGSVDLWINNAGTNAYSYSNLIDNSPEDIKRIVDTNVLGTLLCCKEAISLMSQQPTKGHIFNMEGAGSDGRPTRMYAAYGFTKAGIQQLTSTLADEVKGSQVGVHSLSPGLVFTELVSAGQYTFGQTGRFFINTIGERPEIVAEDLVPQLREIGVRRQGAGGSLRIEFLTPDKLVKKLYRRFRFGEYKDRFFLEDDPQCPQHSKASNIKLQWTPQLEGVANRIADTVRRNAKK
eukprot:scaffold996_cov409-Prasinococcus_capsulatus_cf.AAC.9